MYITKDLLNKYEASKGKYFKVYVTCYSEHPKMKFEHHLIDKYPEKYKDYPMWFIGWIDRICLDKYRQDYFIEFHNVDYPIRK